MQFSDGKFKMFVSDQNQILFLVWTRNKSNLKISNIFDGAREREQHKYKIRLSERYTRFISGNSMHAIYAYKSPEQQQQLGIWTKFTKIEKKKNWKFLQLLPHKAQIQPHRYCASVQDTPVRRAKWSSQWIVGNNNDHLLFCVPFLFLFCLLFPMFNFSCCCCYWTHIESQ